MKDEIKTSVPAPKPTSKPAPKPRDPYIRAENEDDDGYDPYSDRRPEREPLFEAAPGRFAPPNRPQTRGGELGRFLRFHQQKRPIFPRNCVRDVGVGWLSSGRLILGLDARHQNLGEVVGLEFGRGVGFAVFADQYVLDLAIGVAVAGRKLDKLNGRVHGVG